MKVVQNPELMLHELEGECMLYDGTAKKVHVLNHSAQFIWDQCLAPVTPDEISRRLQVQYEIDQEAARTHTTNTIRTFLDRAMVTEVGE